MESNTNTGLPKWNTATVLIALVVAYVVYSSANSVYEVYFGPLSKVPGPKVNTAIPTATVLFPY